MRSAILHGKIASEPRLWAPTNKMRTHQVGRAILVGSPYGIVAHMSNAGLCNGLGIVDLSWIRRVPWLPAAGAERRNTRNLHINKLLVLGLRFRRGEGASREFCRSVNRTSDERLLPSCVATNSVCSWAL